MVFIIHHQIQAVIKKHRSGIPIPNSKQPVVKQPEGSALINKKWEPYNRPPFYHQYDLKGVEGHGVKIRAKRGQGYYSAKTSPSRTYLSSTSYFKI